MAKKKGTSTLEIFLFFIGLIIVGSIVNGLLSIKDYFEQRAEDKYYGEYKEERLDHIELLLHEDFLNSSWYKEHAPYLVEQWGDEESQHYTYVLKNEREISLVYSGTSDGISNNILDFLQSTYGEEQLFLSIFTLELPKEELYVDAGFVREQFRYFGGNEGITTDSLETRFQDKKYEFEEQSIMGMICDVTTYISTPTWTYNDPNISFLCDPLNEVIVGRELYDWSR